MPPEDKDWRLRDKISVVWSEPLASNGERTHSNKMTSPPEHKMATEAKGELRHCAWAGCTRIGHHKAPVSKKKLREYQYFCLDHVRIYNRAWNYYEGMSDSEVETAVRSDTVWNRPTWPMGSDNDAAAVPPEPGLNFEGCTDVFGFFDHESEPSHVAGEQLSGKERQAVLILGLELPVTEDEVKARYKALVKRHHPDANGGDKRAEERFKKINEAYEIITGVLNS